MELSEILMPLFWIWIGGSVVMLSIGDGLGVWNDYPPAACFLAALAWPLYIFTLK